MKKKKNIEPVKEGKMSIYDYEEKYVRHQNARAAKIAIRFCGGVVGVFLAWCLFNVTMQLWDKNMYVGIGSAVVSVGLYVAFYIVPLVKVLKTDYFITNVNSRTALQAKKHNRQIRRRIAEKMIDFSSNVDGVGWYESEYVDRLETALKNNDDFALKDTLSLIYSGRIRQSSRDIIVKCALKSGLYSAVSQSNQADSMLVAVVNLQLVKDLIYLYGFRPSDAKLVKIFADVVKNALVAYGLGGANIGNGIARSMGDAVKGIPLLGSAIGVLVDSSVQGLTNGTLTAIIGYQTIKYLNTEYHLQDLLDNVDITPTEEEFNEECKQIEYQLKKRKSA